MACVVVTATNRARHTAELTTMFEDRKRVFVDKLKWDVPVVDGKYEMDQFDTDDAIYLIAFDPKTRRHRGSVRILPTAKPHLLGDVFEFLCEHGAPRGEDIYEISRLCAAPDLDKADALQSRAEVATALVEFALLFGISSYTGVAHMQWLSQVLAAPWDARPLGLPQESEGQRMGAIQIHITPMTLQMFRANAPNRIPVLELEGLQAAA